MTESSVSRPTANVAVLRGAIRGEPTRRELPGGGVVVQFDVVTSVGADGATINMSVPVAWADPPNAALAWATGGVDVLIVGSVRRRFFRVGGATQSRTEVVAESVIPLRRRKQVAAAIDAAVETMRAA